MKIIGRTLLLLALLPITKTIAQESDTTVTKLDEVIIAENRIQLPYSEQSRSISLVQNEEIKNSPAISTADLLHYVGGVDVRTRGANGIQSDIGIRGGTFEQTLILVNGIKLNDPQTGHHSMNLPINLQQIERIEVLKGPSARTFGQNAFAGAINLVTKEPEKSYATLGLQGGDFKLWGVNASGGLITGKNSHQVAFSYNASDGYKHNTDYSLLNAFYQGSIGVGNGKLNLLAGFTDRAFGANGFYASPAYTEQYETVQTGLASISYELPIGTTRLTTRAYYRQNNDEYIFIRDDPEYYKNNHTGKTIGLEANWVIPFENSTTGIGVDLNSVSLNSNNLGERERFVSTMFLEHHMEFFNDRLSITPGVQLNNYSDFGFNTLPGVDLGYHLNQSWTVYGNVGYTYRVPSYTDMYYSDPVNEGNPDLKPEYAWNYEVGIKNRRNNVFTTEVGLFIRDGKNMIDWVRASDTDPWKPVNLLGLRMSGVDMQSTISLHSFLPALFDLLSIKYTYIDAQVSDYESLLSRYALENLKHQLRVGLQLKYGNNITHTITIGYYDRVNLEDYMVCDTRLAFRVPKFSVFVDVTNVFDETYQETNLVVMPGRWAKAGIAYSFL
ncbi:MAG: TonB-dependent receptor [Cyclobacteriaceae bacterium]|nr:TonB-dependent receptor [Cyclobacteriaceae bacterium]